MAFLPPLTDGPGDPQVSQSPTHPPHLAAQVAVIFTRPLKLGLTCEMPFKVEFEEPL